MCSVVTQAKLPEASISYRSKLYHIQEERNVIGRKEDCFLYVRDAFVARNHCIIEQTCDNNFVIRCTSIFGTFVNEKMLKNGQSQSLKHLDEIKLTDKERRVPMVFLLNSELEVYGPMKKILLDLTQAQLAKMKNIEKEISEVESKKSCLEEENVRLGAQENSVNRKRMRFSKGITPTQEQNNEVEEEKLNDEKEKKMQEIKLEIGKLAKKEKKLQQKKNEIEIRHQKEREELGIRWQAEINKLTSADTEREKKRVSRKSLNKKEKRNLARKLLLRSESELYSICEEKFNLQPQQGSDTTDDFTKENENENENDAVMKKMEKKLKEKEKAEEKQKQDIAELEEELLCSICAEIYFEPKVLNCGHLFCKFCIKEWMKTRNSCPVCRAAIISCIRIHSIDSIIEKNIAMISDTAKERRKELIKERSRVAVVRPVKRTRCCHSMLNSPRQFGSTINMQETYNNELVLRINQPDQGIILFSPNNLSSDAWNVTTNEQGERVYRYYLNGGLRESQPPAATVTTTDTSMSLSVAVQPRTQDTPTTSTTINMIDLTDQ